MQFAHHHIAKWSAGVCISKKRCFQLSQVCQPNRRLQALVDIQMHLFVAPCTIAHFSWGAAITVPRLLKTLLQLIFLFKTGFFMLENVWFQLIKSFCNTWSFKIQPYLSFQLYLFFFLTGCWQYSYDGTQCVPWLKHLQNSETRLN